MSFVDLATLTLHRRNEMETRIHVFLDKADHAINDIKKMKQRAQEFVQQLNCEPSELKENFLKCMKKLDEYTYLMTDFNLSVANLEEATSMESMPVQDSITAANITIPAASYNLIDALSEPSTSAACSKFIPSSKPTRLKVPKKEQCLIEFSSASCSSESVPQKNDAVEKKEKEVQCELPQEISQLSINDTPSTSNANNKDDIFELPAQPVLQVDHIYPGTIMNIDGPSFWIITAPIDEVYKLMTEMTQYYKRNRMMMTKKEFKSTTYCACYDPVDDCYYRGFFIEIVKEDTATAFFLDTGEVRQVPVKGILPLVPQFCQKPPYARCCHLAGVDSVFNKEMSEQQEKFLEQYNGFSCDIQVDDNSSESLGVYVILLPSKVTLNSLLLKHASSNSDPEAGPSRQRQASPAPPMMGPPEFSEQEIDIMEGPEYEDPLEAVTGYHNRDEAEICKHYKGGPEKTCFKGARCNKRHVVMNPDGWTLDQVPVLAKCKSLPLPPPGSWQKVHVTCVCHFDRIYVQFVEELDKDDELPRFGVVLPPLTLKGLVRDMNSPAARTAYKPLTMIPAPGEMVAALYPPDDQWYRARVLSVTRSDQSVEVKYIDYGNVVWVKENNVRILEPRLLELPAQAVRCVIAGVHARSEDSAQWAQARAALADLVQDRTFDAQVIARDYDELTVELIDVQGYSIAEQLAATGVVDFKEFSIVEDRNVASRVVVP